MLKSCFLDRWGKDSLCNDISIIAGGSLLNSAVHGANFSSYHSANIQLNAFGVVGRDIQGDICMKALNQRDMLRNNVIVTSDCPTGTCIVLSGRQDRSFVTNRGRQEFRYV